MVNVTRSGQISLVNLGVEGEIAPRSVQKVIALEHIKIVKVAFGDTFTTAISEGNVFSCCGKINYF